jgi:hypothetical protein
MIPPEEQHSDDEPIRRISDTGVVTDDGYIKANTVEMYPNWTHIYTKRGQPETDAELWVPNEKIQEVGAEHSEPY